MLRKSSTTNLHKQLETDPDALRRHVARFCNADGVFNPHTVAEGLEKMHASHSTVKGAVIATFNATHCAGGLFPATSATFKPDEKTGYAKNLHMGTTRVWKADGSINEERWNALVAFVTAGQDDAQEKIVTIGKLQDYLARCYNEDKPESTTGRNANSWFSSKYAQGTAATQAWNQVFESLACGWVEGDKAGSLQPYLTLDLMRTFFEDSTKAFQLAEDQKLPVPKPESVTESLSVRPL